MNKKTDNPVENPGEDIDIEDAFSPDLFEVQIPHSRYESVRVKPDGRVSLKFTPQDAELFAAFLAEQAGLSDE